MSESSGQVSALRSAAELWLESKTTIDAAQRRDLAELAPKLIHRIPRDRPSAIGIAAPPGCGKSTVANMLAQLLSTIDVPSLVLSLDDYYLGDEQRRQLAETVHPLFRQRGVPGTHDVSKLLFDFDRIRRGEIEGLSLPVFDKGKDDRAPESAWRNVTEIPQCIFLEGWFVGAPAQSPENLAQAVNVLESDGDVDGQWRRAVNDALLDFHGAFHRRLDQVWYLAAPGWQSVIDWRWRQEQDLAVKKLESREEVVDFLARFQRLVEHMQKTSPEWADLILAVDHHHKITMGG
jgi:D-glycerate 3-kinase